MCAWAYLYGLVIAFVAYIEVYIRHRIMRNQNKINMVFIYTRESHYTLWLMLLNSDSDSEQDW